jgi:hypothetical protein
MEVHWAGVRYNDTYDGCSCSIASGYSFRVLVKESFRKEAAGKNEV